MCKHWGCEPLSLETHLRHPTRHSRRQTPVYDFLKLRATPFPVTTPNIWPDLTHSSSQERRLEGAECAPSAARGRRCPSPGAARLGTYAWKRQCGRLLECWPQQLGPCLHLLKDSSCGQGPLRDEGGITEARAGPGAGGRAAGGQGLLGLEGAVTRRTTKTSAPREGSERGPWPSAHL